MQAYDHQEAIIRQDPMHALIALGTGGGKTRVCLELAEGKTLVICPKQQKLDRTWENNAEKFGLVVNMTVVSKEEFRRDVEKIGAFDTVIADECHTLLGVTTDTRTKNKIKIPKTSQLFEAFIGYLERTRPKRIYLASATPVTKPMNLWAIGRIFGKDWDFFKFRARFYIERRMGMREIWIQKKSKDLEQKLADLTRSFGFVGTLSDWFDVPEQIHETIYVPLTDQQNNAIARIQSENADPLAVRARCRTIENGILYGHEVVGGAGNVENMVRNSEKFQSEKSDHVVRLAQKFEKVLVFAAYTGQIESLQESLAAAGIRTWTLTGATKDRQNVVSDAQNAPSGVVIAQASISSGYELPSFPCVVFASKSFRYVDYEQGLGRVLRANFIKQNFYYHLVVKGGPDEDCHKAIMSGADFQEKVMENNQL